MRELSLFSGVGGGLLGTKLLGWTAVGYVENEQYCQKILKQRIADGILDPAPIFGDIRRFNSHGYAESYQGMVDIITAGFPCQPFSVAGKRAAADDPRNMWPATVECIRLVRPRYALLENVPGLLTSGYFGTILGELESSGYDTGRRCLSAAEMGAPHKRKRLWVLAVSKSAGDGFDSSERRKLSAESGGESEGQANEDIEACGSSPPEELADAGSEGSQERSQSEDGRGTLREKGQAFKPSGDGGWWAQDPADLVNTTGAGPAQLQEVQKRCEQSGRNAAGSTGCRLERWTGPAEPELGRVAHGMANRVDRLKAIGNGQVPAVAAAAWILLNEGV